jgi:hypothetical protein
MARKHPSLSNFCVNSNLQEEIEETEEEKNSKPLLPPLAPVQVFITRSRLYRQTSGALFSRDRVAKQGAARGDLGARQEFSQEHDPCPKKDQAIIPNQKTDKGHMPA